MIKAAFSGWLLSASVLMPLAAQAAERIDVFKTSGCACCIGWMKVLEAAGYAVVGKNVAMGDLMQMKLRAGFTIEQTSCHTATIGGYTIEGHVPVREIARLLRERPAAIGLSVPGMPAGSPGMDYGERETYSVLLVRQGGASDIYQQY